MVAWPDAEQADDLGLQADKLTRQRLGRRAAAPLLERLERALVALLAPLGEQRGVLGLAAQQCALALLVEPLIPSNR
jgi:hypothetical protein